MTTADFKKLMEQCRTPRELEKLLQRWHEVVGTWQELTDLREEWVSRSVALSEACERGECPVALEMKGVQAA